MRLRESDFTPINPLDFYSTTLYHKHKDVANNSRHNQVGIFVLIASFVRSYSICFEEKERSCGDSKQSKGNKATKLTSFPPIFHNFPHQHSSICLNSQPFLINLFELRRLLKFLFQGPAFYETCSVIIDFMELSIKNGVLSDDTEFVVAFGLYSSTNGASNSQRPLRHFSETALVKGTTEKLGRQRQQIIFTVSAKKFLVFFLLSVKIDIKVSQLHQEFRYVSYYMYTATMVNDITSDSYLWRFCIVIDDKIGRIFLPGSHEQNDSV